jgi:hypothetical protein
MLAPGSGAKLDQYGNMNRGQLQQILSQLRAGFDSLSWQSQSKRSRRNVKRAGRIFWSRGGHLARGAWLAQGRTVTPLLVAVSSARYRLRIDLPDVAKRVVSRTFSLEFERFLKQELKK